MNDFVTVLLRWTVRIVLLLAGAVFFLSLLAAAGLLALVWGMRALWAKFTGRPVAPWVMGVQPAAAWNAVYRSRSVWSAGRTPAPAAAPVSPGAPSGRRRGGLLRGADDVVDVQPRDVRES